MNSNAVPNEEKSPLFSNVLLLEDDPAHTLLITRALKSFVKDKIHTVTTVIDCVKFLESEEAKKIECIVSDLNVSDGKEMQVVEPIIASAKNIPLIVLTSSTSLQTAIEAMKRGARDYLVKNFGPDFKDMIGLALQRVEHAARLQSERIRLEKEMAILRLAVENGVDGVAIITSESECLYTNFAFSELIERIGGTISQSVNTLFNSPQVIGNHSLNEQLLERLSGKTEASFWSTELLTDKSTGITYRIELSRIDDRSTWALWLRDISEAKRRERFQREMLSTTTHDLKGPLGAILLSSEMISSKNELPERIRDLAVRIGSSAQGAVNIIDEFLSARRLEEGTFVLKPTNCLWNETLEKLKAQYESLLKAKNIDFSLKLDPNFRANYDELGFIRVLGNLLSNAIKFTPKNGSVQICLNTTDQDQEYILSISDSGQGMEAQEVSRLFERFSRLAKHVNVEGTGLGLYVVKCIVEAHGGRISVTSAPHLGTTFEITLPINPPVNAKGELFVLDF